jgi:hypothetical protein
MYCLPCQTIGLVFPDISKGMTLYTQAAITNIEAKGIPSKHNAVIPYSLYFAEHPINTTIQGIRLSKVKFEKYKGAQESEVKNDF